MIQKKIQKRTNAQQFNNEMNDLSAVKVMKTENLAVVTVCVFPCNLSY